MDNNSSLNWSANYGSCPGCGGNPPAITQLPPVSAVGDIPRNPNIPTLEEIAGYNYMNAAEKQRLRQQLDSMGSSLSPARGEDIPFAGGQYQPPPYRLQANNSNLMAQTTSPPMSTMNQEAPITPTTQPMPLNVDSLQYMNGFLRTQVGRPVRVEFLIGTNNLVDRAGILVGVGANYILINETETDDILLCDFYNIKFVRFYY